MRGICVMLMACLALLGGTVTADDGRAVMPQAGLAVGSGVTSDGLRISLVVGTEADPAYLHNAVLARPDFAFGRMGGFAMTPKAALELADYLRNGQPEPLPIYESQHGVTILDRDSESALVLFKTTKFDESVVIVARLTWDELETLAALIESSVDRLLGR